MINAAGLKLIEDSEGLRLTSYNDGGNVPTIGWGHTKGVEYGQTITRDQAVAFLEDDLKDAEAAVDKYVLVPLNENQRAALVSFTFNVGAGALEKSTLLSKLNAKYYTTVPDELLKWNHDNGKVVTGLTTRRREEGVLWNTPVVTITPIPVSIPATVPPATVQENWLITLIKAILGVFSATKH